LVTVKVTTVPSLSTLVAVVKLGPEMLSQAFALGRGLEAQQHKATKARLAIDAKRNHAFVRWSFITPNV
jgi:hypothetical protein